MTRLSARQIDFFDRQVVELMVEKYGMDDREAVRAFIESKTYQLLLDVESEVYTMSPHIIFDMCESEKIT